MNEEEFILANLSLYEFMTLEQFLFDCDQKEVEKFPDLTKDRLLTVLKSLEKRGLVESKDQTSWRKNFPQKRGFFSFLLRRFIK